MVTSQPAATSFVDITLGGIAKQMRSLHSKGNPFPYNYPQGNTYGTKFLNNMGITSDHSYGDKGMVSQQALTRDSLIKGAEDC